VRLDRIRLDCDASYTNGVKPFISPNAVREERGFNGLFLLSELWSYRKSLVSFLL
jgi:hypothetical protein